MRVRDVMRAKVVTLPQNATLKEVLETFIKHHLDCLPVVDAATRVVGLVTIDDLVDLFLPRYYEILRDIAALQDKGQLSSLFNQGFAGLDGHHEKLILAADVMRRLHWIAQEESLLEAAALLQSQHLRRLPVVDRDGRLVGLLSDFDITLALLNGAPASPDVRRPTSANRN